MKAKTRRLKKKRKTMKGGKKYEGVRRIASGAEGVAYLTANNKLLKVMKRGINITNEITIHRKLNELNLPYFPKFLNSGRALSESELNLSNATITGLFNNTGEYTYTYVLMDFVEGGKEFPKYFSDKIEEILPGKTRALTSAEVNGLVNQLLITFGKIVFALYIADKVFNYRHNDLNERNCLIRPNGDPVIIDFGSNEMQYNNKRNNNSGKNSYEYFSIITLNRYHKDKNKDYINQIRINPVIQRFFELAAYNYRITIEYIAQCIRAAKTGTPIKTFNYRETFRELGIDSSELGRAEIYIKDREPRLSPVRRINDEIAYARQIIEGFGFPLTHDKMDEIVQEAVSNGMLTSSEIATYVTNKLLTD